MPSSGFVLYTTSASLRTVLGELRECKDDRRIMNLIGVAFPSATEDERAHVAYQLPTIIATLSERGASGMHYEINNMSLHVRDKMYPRLPVPLSRQ